MIKPIIRKSDDEMWECSVDGVHFWGIGSTPIEAYENWKPYAHLTNDMIAAALDLDINDLRR